jgi:hypothetical protein
VGVADDVTAQDEDQRYALSVPLSESGSARARLGAGRDRAGSDLPSRHDRHLGRHRRARAERGTQGRSSARSASRGRRDRAWRRAGRASRSRMSPAHVSARACRHRVATVRTAPFPGRITGRAYVHALLTGLSPRVLAALRPRRARLSERSAPSFGVVVRRGRGRLRRHRPACW